MVGLLGFPFDENFAAVGRGLTSQPGGVAQGRGQQRRSSRVAIAIPRYAYTFLVEFVISQDAINQFLTNSYGFVRSGRLYTQIKTIDFPRHQFKMEKMRSYNRVVNVPTQIEYQPATIAFHDDAASMAMALYMDYLNYYHESGSIGRDLPNLGNASGRYSIDSQLTGDQSRLEMEKRASLGMKTRPDSGRCFFEAIVIHDLGTEPDSVNRHVYINPTLTTCDHDGYDNTDKTKQMSMTWTFEYEGYALRVGENNTVSSGMAQIVLDKPLLTSRSTGHAVMTQPPKAPTNLFDQVGEQETFLSGEFDNSVEGATRLPDGRFVFNDPQAAELADRELGKLPVGSTIPRGSELDRILNDQSRREVGVPPAGSSRAATQDASRLGNIFNQRNFNFNVGGLNIGTAGTGGFSIGRGNTTIYGDRSVFNNAQYGYGTQRFGADPNYYTTQQMDSRRYAVSQQQERITALQQERNLVLARDPSANTSYYDREIALANNSINQQNASTNSLSRLLTGNRDTASALLNTLNLLA